MNETTRGSPRSALPALLPCWLRRGGVACTVIMMFVAALTACEAVGSDLAGARGSVVSSPNDSRAYRLIALENGMEVMLVSDPSAEKSAAALSIGVGAASDPEDYPGMAHYLEHMLFMGSGSFPSPTGLWLSLLSTAACPMPTPGSISPIT